MSQKSFITANGDVSPRQAASALGVSESSIKRWVDQGRLAAVKTPGGHRRLPVQGLLQFARESGLTVDAPAPLADISPPLPRRIRASLSTALLADDSGAVRQLLELEWLGGRSVESLCDDLIVPVLAHIGERWAAGAMRVDQERRACELVRRALLLLAERLTPAPDNGLALGGALESDPYELPTLMAELVLRERGFDARSLGAGLPALDLALAIAERRPRLVWVAVAVCVDEQRFAADFARVTTAASQVGAPVVVGGRGLTRSLRQRLRYSAFCDAMAHLGAFACALSPAPGAGVARYRRRGLTP